MINPVHILLVEDNEGDILLTQEALSDGKILHTLSVVKDGDEAISFMNKQHKYKQVESPDIVLLDINLPKKNGHEVLKYMKEKDSIKHIPVIMLTTSSFEKDINQAYSNHANCYITKPVDVSDFLDVVVKIENFWISIVKLPSFLKT